MVSLLLADQFTEVDLTGVTSFTVVRPFFTNKPVDKRWWSIVANFPNGRQKTVLTEKTWEKAFLKRNQLRETVIDLGVSVKIHETTGSVVRR